MKSNKEKLEQRGFLPQAFNLASCNFLLEEELCLLESNISVKRTLGARLLKNRNATNEIIDCLIKALRKEKKLYSKIEISKTLEAFGKPTVNSLIVVLGKIGSNQHKVVPQKEFKKNNYPLPRDIAARIIGHIGKDALAALESQFKIMSKQQQAEAIDAIGYICFYNYSPHIYELLQRCYEVNQNNDLIKWKLLRAFSGFSESEGFLTAEKERLQNQRLKLEINRSVSLIQKRKGEG